LLIIGPLLAGVAAYFATQEIKPVYQATATILVDRRVTPGALDYNDVLTSERLTNTYAQLVERPAVLDDVIKRMNLGITRQELGKKIDVQTIKDTQLLSISVKDGNPAYAALLTNTTAESFAADNESQLAPAGTVKIAKAAEIPTSPISPNLVINMSLAVILGAMLAGAFGLLLDYLDDTVKTEEDIQEIASLPTLGQIGRFKPDTGPAFVSGGRSHTAEAYRQLRTNVHFTTLGAELKTIVITSANPGEGKSTTAANLATVLAQAGDRVILVDTDLRRSTLRKTFEGPSSFGLTGLLLNDSADPKEALITTRWKNLQLLPTGILPPNPSELLTSTRMNRVIESLRGLADYVIFDTPPVIAVTDAIVLAARTDGTILVAESGRTRTEALRLSVRTLTQANAKPIGVVLNKTKVNRTSEYYYYSDEEEAAVKEGVLIDPVAPPSAVAVIESSPEIPAPERPAQTIDLEQIRAQRREAVVQSEAVTAPAEPAEPASQQAEPSVAPPVEIQRPAAVQPLQPPPLPAAANGNGSGASYGNGNGNGHTMPVPVPAAASSSEPARQPDSLDAVMSELLAHMNGTAGLIRSLRPDNKESDA